METDRRRARLVGLAFTGSLLVAFDAAALGLLGDGRAVHSRFQSVSDDVDLREDEVPSAPFAPFEAETMQARQSSSMVLSESGLTMTWTADGRAQGFFLTAGAISSRGDPANRCSRSDSAWTERRPSACVAC